MFTQVTSGPITRYQEIRSQLIRRRFSMDRLETGLREFTIGLSLKVLLANQLGRLWSQVGAIGYESISTPLAGWELLHSAFSFTLTFTATPSWPGNRLDPGISDSQKLCLSLPVSDNDGVLASVAYNPWKWFRD